MPKITWLALASIWRTLAVLYDRGFGNETQIFPSDDNTWGFGQAVPLVLVILPFVSFFEVAYGEL